MAKETYLGDGLYASYDGFMYTLRAPRGDLDHWVGLEPMVLDEFLAFVSLQQPKAGRWVFVPDDKVEQ